MLTSLTRGNADDFKSLFESFVLSSLSYFDVSGKMPEKFYHAFTLGLFVSLRDTYQIKSEREAGTGRYDVILTPKNKNNFGIIIEFKKVYKSTNKTSQEILEQAVDTALEQIETKKYETELKDLGINKVLKLGIAFEGKNVLVRKGTKK
jgi:hypothetical protein